MAVLGILYISHEPVCKKFKIIFTTHSTLIETLDYVQHYRSIHQYVNLYMLDGISMYVELPLEKVILLQTLEFPQTLCLISLRTGRDKS